MPHRTRVLVVDDNQEMDDSLLALLESHGCNAKGVYSARTIVADVRDFDPDVVIMAIAMPERWDAARQIRLHRPGKRPLLIAVSGQRKGGERIFTEMSAYDYYVIKPCAPSALLELVALHARTRFRGDGDSQTKTAAARNVWHMTEATVRDYAHVYKDAEKLEGSLEVRKTVGSTSDWQQLPPK
jgi:DNA-binding response OmpR family regulator